MAAAKFLLSPAPVLQGGAEAEVEAVEAPDDMDANISVADVPIEEGDGGGPDISEDSTIRIRSLSKRDLCLECNTLKHKTYHFPHNPYCPICVEANMRQRSFARASEPEDDGLNAFDAPLKRLGADIIVVSISSTDQNRVSASSNMVAHTIRDQYSGMATALPSHTKSSDVFLSLIHI